MTKDTPLYPPSSKSYKTFLKKKTPEPKSEGFPRKETSNYEQQPLVQSEWKETDYIEMIAQETSEKQTNLGTFS